MNIPVILRQIVELTRAKPSVVVSNLLFEAFNVDNNKDLLLARAFMVNELDKAYHRLDGDDIYFVKETLDEIYSFLSHTNFNTHSQDNTMPKLTYAHISTIHTLLMLDSKNTKGIVKNSEILQELNTELKALIIKDELNENEKEILTSFSDDVDNTIQESKIIGDKAFINLQALMLGKFALYKDAMQNLKESKSFKSVLKIYNAVEKINKAVQEFKLLDTNIQELIGFIV